MSTAALASARRRRTTNDIASSQNVSNKTTQQDSPNSSKQVMPSPPPPQSLTPLQILQLHDNKLKDLEALMIELNSEDYITNVVEEKINDLMQEKLVAFSSDLDKIAPSTTNNSNSDLAAKIQIMETSIQTNLNIQNVRLDEFKENTIKMIELLTSKENHMSSANVNVSNVNVSNVEKIDMLTKEVNELKLLVIKSQTLALETCNSILSMKDEFKLINEKIMQNANTISAMNTRQCDAPQCDPAQMFLQSFMKNKLFGGGNIMNMGDDYEEDDDGGDYDDETNLNMNKKLHIDLNNEEVILNDEEVILNDEEVNLDNNVEENLNTEELIIDEKQLQEILELNSMPEVNLNSDPLKQEVIDEIRKIETNVAETNVAHEIS